MRQRWLGPFWPISTEDTVERNKCFPSACSGCALSAPAFHHSYHHVIWDKPTATSYWLPTRLIRANVSYVLPCVKDYFNFTDTISLSSHNKGMRWCSSFKNPWSWDFCIQKDVVNVFFSYTICPLPIPKNADIIYKTNKIRLQKVGRKVNQLGTPGPEEWHSDKFPGFYSWLYIRDLELKKLATC